MFCGEPLTSGRLCRACATAPLAVDGVRSVFPMRDAVRDALHALKYRSVRVLAGPLGAEMVIALDALPVRPSLLLPVPLHPSRLRSRGYNQAALLARSLGTASGIPAREDVLARLVPTPPQARSASRSDRMRNVASAFSAHGDLTGQTVAVVDDVCTTGATLAACAHALYAAGADKVFGVTVAREV
jgi:ComF family protein